MGSGSRGGSLTAGSLGLGLGLGPTGDDGSAALREVLGELGVVRRERGVELHVGLVELVVALEKDLAIAEGDLTQLVQELYDQVGGAERGVELVLLRTWQDGN